MIIKSRGKKVYWNIVSEEEMKKMLEIAKRDYKKAIEKMPIRDYTKDYILNEKKRGKIIELILKFVKGKEKKVLDVGAGFGAVTLALSRNFDTTAVDVNPFTLKFIKYRAKQEKLKIKTKLINHIYYGLPFKKETFDVVLMNGVLEWVGEGVEGDVVEIQKKVLEEIKRVLKKQGFLFLAIENRIALDWFKGKTSHVPIKYIDLLPRKLANFISKRKLKKEFRTYIYTKLGYKKLLKKVGFKNIRFYTAHPTYQKPEKIYKNKNPFVNSFIIVAEK